MITILVVFVFFFGRLGFPQDWYDRDASWSTFSFSSASSTFSAVAFTLFRGKIIFVHIFLFLFNGYSGKLQI